MNYPNTASSFGSKASRTTDRVGFIRRTYLHLFLNIILFSLATFAVLSIPIISNTIFTIAGTGWGWLIVLIAFGIGAGFLQSLAYRSSSKGVQYGALLGFIALEAVIFSPIAVIGARAGVLGMGLLATSALFGILTVQVMLTKQNFDFLRGFLVAGSLISFGAMIVGTIFKLSIFGTIFSVLMIILMCGWVLYDTSKIVRNYPTDKYIAASIAIFADFVTLLWYVIRLLSNNS